MKKEKRKKKNYTDLILLVSASSGLPLSLLLFSFSCLFACFQPPPLWFNIIPVIELDASTPLVLFPPVSSFPSRNNVYSTPLFFSLKKKNLNQQKSNLTICDLLLSRKRRKKKQTNIQNDGTGATRRRVSNRMASSHGNARLSVLKVCVCTKQRGWDFYRCTPPYSVSSLYMCT